MSKLIVNTIEAQTYKYDSDTTGFSLNSAGAITGRNPYYWHVRRGGGNVSVNTDIVFDTVEDDDNSIYNSTTGVITIPVTGIYQMNFLGIGTSGDNNIAVGVYTSSNSLYDQMMMYGDGSNYYPNASFSFARKFTKNDTVKLRVTGGTIWAGQGSGQPTWTGYLVG
jgi:hypothetical protein